MRRLVMFLMTVSLAAILCACSNPLKAATDVVESTTETTVILEDASTPPSFIFYDPDDSTQAALTLDAVSIDWHYEDDEGTLQTISADEIAEAAALASASGDASDASGDAAYTANETDNAIIAAAYMSLPVLDVDDDSETYYSVDPGATPDRLVETSWKAEYIGSESADAMEIYTKLASFYTLPLKTERVYQITVTWDEENYETRGYYGTLTYLFQTQ